MENSFVYYFMLLGLVVIMMWLAGLLEVRQAKEKIKR